MTREEAIKELEEMIKYEWGTYQTKTARIYVNALDMAIKALEQAPTTQELQAESDKFDAAFQDGYNNGYAQARFDYEQEAITKDDLSKYCDRNICLKNEYNNVGCEDCEVTKSQEPTTNNDLGVDAVSRQAVLDIAKTSKSNWIDNSILFKRVNALPSVTPQEPILDKIRAEIESQRKEVSKKYFEDEKLTNYYFGLNDGLKDARDIIDKYKAEEEG